MFYIYIFFIIIFLIYLLFLAVLECIPLPGPPVENAVQLPKIILII